MQHSPYYNPEALARETAAGRHRDAIGGLWDELGQLQLDFLIAKGLKPQHRLLDIGCGALRLGVKAVDYLEPGNYHGLDISPELMEAGYLCELSEAQRRRLPRENLHISADFDFSFLNNSTLSEEPPTEQARGAQRRGERSDGGESPLKIDYAMAQSVFTHLPFNHIRRCLARLAPHLVPGAVFYATAWLIPETHPLHEAYTQPGCLGDTPIVTTDTADPYHYRPDDFRHAIANLPYRLELVGDWKHPRGQPMLAFQRV